MEPATELIVDAPLAHLLAGNLDNVQSLRPSRAMINPQQEFERHRRGKLGRPAKAAIERIIALDDAPVGCVQQIFREHLAGLFGNIEASQLTEQCGGIARYLISLIAVSLRHAKQDARKARHVVTIFWRKIRPTIKRSTLRSEEYGHGPAAMLGHHLDCIHVDLIEIGPLFTINLDIDEVLVHQFGDLFILERFVLHHVTPVTGRVANTE